MATPRKRDRVEDDDEEELSPSLWNSVVGLFSTAKKKPKRQRTSTPATHLPRLNLSPPSTHVSPPAETNGTRPAPFAAVTTTPARASALPPARAAPSPWQAAPIQFSPGLLVLSSRRRPARYRPLSRTLVQVPGKRQRPMRTEWNAELAARVLEQSQELFRPQENGYNTTTVHGRRQMGTNQRGSRLAAAPAARKQVSFEESHFQKSPQVATTPRVPRRTSQERVTTPYVAARPQVSPVPSDEDFEEEEPLPVDYAAMPRPEVSRDSEFIFFDYPEEELGDASRGTLVEFKKRFRTLTVTSVPPPGRNPRHVFQPLQEVSEDEAPTQAPPAEEEEPAQAPPAEESPKNEEPTSKKTRLEGSEGWGNLFANIKPGWKCDTCCIRNELEDYLCKACETPRPGTGTTSGVGVSVAGGNGGCGGAAAGGAANGRGANAAAAPIAFGANIGGSTAPVAFGGSIGTGGFRFGGVEATKEKSHGRFKYETSTKSEGEFLYGKTETSPDEAPKPTGFSFRKSEVTKEDVAKTNSEKKDEANTPAIPATPFSFGIKPPAKSEPPKITFGVTPAAEPATEGKRLSIGFIFGAKPEMGESATKKLKFPKPVETEKEESAPGFSFGAADSTAMNSMGPPPNKPFIFGTAAPATGNSAKLTFSIGGPTAAPGTPSVTTEAQTTLGSTPVLGSSASTPVPSKDDGRRKKRRSTADDDEEEEKEIAFTQPSVIGATPAPAPAAGTTSFGAPAVSNGQGGVAPFGSTPARSGAAPRFGTTPAAATAQSLFTFGSTPAAATPLAPSFGAPVSAAPALSTGGFGQNGGSNPFGMNAAPSFGPSAMTPAPVAPEFNFGASIAAAAPTFGTPAPPPPSQGFSFGSTPAVTSVAPFGAIVAMAPATGGFSFGTAPGPAGGGFRFGGTPSQATMTPGFGGETMTPAPTPGFDGFGTTPGFSGFGAAPSTGGLGVTPGAPPITPAGGGFNIGSGGGGGRLRASTGHRRIVKARRPPGSGVGR